MIGLSLFDLKQLLLHNGDIVHCVLRSPKCLTARAWPLHSNSLLESPSVSLWTLRRRGRRHIPLLLLPGKEKENSQQKNATRKGDWNSLTGRKPSPLQMPSCLILTVVQLVNMCVIVFCSFVVPLSPFFLAVNTHPMPISQYLIEQAENLKSL